MLTIKIWDFTFWFSSFTRRLFYNRSNRIPITACCSMKDDKEIRLHVVNSIKGHLKTLSWSQIKQFKPRWLLIPGKDFDLLRFANQCVVANRWEESRSDFMILLWTISSKIGSRKRKKIHSKKEIFEKQLNIALKFYCET